MKLKHFYCESTKTVFVENPNRQPSPCIYAIKGSEDRIVLMTTAYLNNLYPVLRGLFANTDFHHEYEIVDNNARLNEYMRGSNSDQGHLDIHNHYDKCSLVILYKRQPKGNQFIASSGTQTLTIEDLRIVVQHLAKSNYISAEFNNAIVMKLAESCLPPVSHEEETSLTSNPERIRHPSY